MRREMTDRTYFLIIQAVASTALGITALLMALIALDMLL
jgi:hypothetical protein